MTTALDMLRRVAQRTREYDFTVWFRGDAIAVDGLIEAAELTGDMANLAHARPTEVNVWGQGGVMRFAAERIRAGQA